MSDKTKVMSAEELERRLRYATNASMASAIIEQRDAQLLAAKEQELGEANVRLWLVTDWVIEEQLKHQRKSKGGQQVGDSHSPRVPLSALRELGRMIDPSQGGYSYAAWCKLEQELAALKASHAELVDVTRRVRICWADEVDRRHFNASDLVLAKDLDEAYANARKTGGAR